MGSVGDESFENCTASDLLRAQSRLLNQTLGFVVCVSLKCAIQLEIPDVIHKHGRPVTIQELSHALQVAPEKSQDLFRLMRILTHSGFFEVVQPDGDGEPAYVQNLTSSLLLKDNPFSLSPFVMTILDPMAVNAYGHFIEWFLNDKATAFETANMVEFWEKTGRNSSWNDIVDQGMASDTRLVSSVLIDGAGMEVFEEMSSLVDVGGGTGSLAKAIAVAFPQIECTVLDLPQVIRGLESSKNLKYVHGDMLKNLPPADAILLKLVLHDSGDDECVKILRRGKDSITQRNGGKVIIIDMLVGNEKADKKETESQLCFDMIMMGLVSGKERTDKEWSKLF